MRWTWPFVCLAAACTPAVTERSGAISGGASDVVDVAVVGVYDDATGATCTGSLVAPDLVVTGQHCVAPVVNIGACDQAGFGAPASPTTFYITTKPMFTFTPSDYHAVAEIVIPPGTGFCGRDIALLRLADQVPSAEASPIAPRVDVAVAAAETFSAVGYGGTDDNGTGAGERRRRDGLTVVCTGAGCATPFLGAEEWRGDEGTCQGDSGGPALDGSGTVIGVVSRGSVGCIAPVYTAIAPHRTWLITEALRAAMMGGYPPPAWTGAVPGDGAEPDPVPDAPPAADETDDGGGCRTSGGGSWLAIAFVLLVIHRRRRER
jgi:hypothetical protein